MNHYHLDIIISEDEVKVIREEFREYLNEAGEFNFIIRTDAGVEPSPELQGALKKMFITLLMSVDTGRFHRVN